MWSGCSRSPKRRRTGGSIARRWRHRHEGLGFAPNNADLYLERGHRELGLREFSKARSDLEQATRIAPQMLDGYYHLGLSHYFLGEFDQAAVSFGKARDLAKTDDSLIDCSNWLYVSLRRAGKEQEAARR
jgi:tetratricopeptide (TPR) repeat protein